MSSILSLIWYILNRGPLALVVIGAALFGAGVYFEGLGEEREQRRAAALAKGPPPVVDIEAFSKRRDVHDFSEVHVRTQLDFSMDYRLTLTGDGADEYAYMIPLVATDAPEGQVPQSYGILMLDHSSFTFDDIDPLQYLGNAETFGAFGPVVTLNGRSGVLTTFEDIVDDSFSREGRALPSSALILREYRNGREAAFAPGQAFDGQIFKNIAFAFLAFAALKGLWARRSRQVAAQQETQEEIGVPEMMQPDAPKQEPAQSVPLWKQRDAARAAYKGLDVYKAKEPVKRERESVSVAAEARTTSWVATAQSRSEASRQTTRRKGLSPEHRFAGAMIVLLALLVVLPLYGTRFGASITSEGGFLSSISLPIEGLLGGPTQMVSIETPRNLGQPSQEQAPVSQPNDPLISDIVERYRATQGR